MKLTKHQKLLLLEAWERYTRFGKGKKLTEAWTGLGSMSVYKPCLSAGLMTYATSPNPGYTTWWKLTPKGAEIVQKWLDAGMNFQQIEQDNHLA